MSHPGFHNRITKEEGAQYQPEKGRYVLYIGLSCPFAHRALISHALKGLDGVVQVVYTSNVFSVVDEVNNIKGWVFGNPANVLPENQVFADILRQHEAKSDEDKAKAFAIPELKNFLQTIDIRQTTAPGIKEGTSFSTVDPIFGAKSVKELYTKFAPDYPGRATVPMLFDKKTSTIVNNESIEICEIFDTAFDDLATNPTWSAYVNDDEAVQSELAKVNTHLTSGVYMAGFATDQCDYFMATKLIADYMNEIEERLKTQRFLTGKKFTQVDICALVILLRFNSVYIASFRVSAKRLQDFPTVFQYVCDIWQNVFNDVARSQWQEVICAITSGFSLGFTPASAKMPIVDPLKLDTVVDRVNL